MIKIDSNDNFCYFKIAGKSGDSRAHKIYVLGGKSGHLVADSG